MLECEVFSSRADDWKKFSDQQRADLLRSELWTIYGHGADGLLLWGFSRDDSFSLTDGEFNARVLACRDTSHLMRMLGLAKLRRTPAQVALLLDPDAYLRTGALDGGSLSGGSALDGECHGLHAAVLAAGIPCDVVMAAQLATAVTRYRALILPASPLMDQATADRLTAFVSAGGTLITVAPFAIANRWGEPSLTVPACGLNELFPINLAGVLPALGGIPTIAFAEHGAGRSAAIAGAVGNAYLGGGAPGLPQVLAGILARGQVLPALRLTCAGAVPPDAALLASTGAGGNRLLVVAAQGDRAGATRTATSVAVEIPGAMPHAVFVCPPTAISDGVVRSGPRSLPATPVAGGCRLELGTVTSALPVLLCGTSTPLLGLEMPARVKVGSPVSVVVTCYNPSAAAMAVSVELRATGATAAATAVRIPAYGQAAVPLTFTPTAATPRLCVTAVLRSGASETVAVPVDLAVE